MTRLNTMDMMLVDDLFGYRSGYVLDFSNYTFQRFFADELGVEIYSDAFSQDGGSKNVFAELLNEPTIPKDWGGEQSDLFTTQTRVDGERLSAAFAFKGPAKFHPMTMADLGKNGDQINRLFAEPADLLVLQHCHQITPPVRGAMRAFAQQMGHLRLFCLIDGYETLRILECFGKCGFLKRN